MDGRPSQLKCARSSYELRLTDSPQSALTREAPGAELQYRALSVALPRKPEQRSAF